MVSQLPANRPWLRKATCPYSEQVGLNRHARGSNGDSHRLYARNNATTARTGRLMTLQRVGESARRRAGPLPETSG